MKDGPERNLIAPKAACACGWNAGTRILLGLSGGPDSVALLHCMLLLKRRGTIGGLCAAHVHHGIRGDSADADAAFCGQLCDELGIALKVLYADAPKRARENRESLETAARELRYLLLEQARTESGCDLIAVAHHRDDQAETVMMHLLRGCGLTGLKGMEYRSGRLIRPLLGTGREEILAYLEENGLSFCTDETNALNDAVRNRVRHELMPMLRSFNPSADKALAVMAELAGRDDALLSRLAESLEESAARPEGSLDKGTLLAGEGALRARVLRKRLFQTMGDVTRRDVERVEALLSAQTGTRIELKDGFAAWTDARSLHIGVYPKAEAFAFPFVFPGATRTPEGRFISEYADAFHMPASSSEAYLDAEKLPPELMVRSARPGDRFHPLGAPGSKRLSDYFTDRKTPVTERVVPLLASGERIWFIPGGTIAQEARITPETQIILHITYEEGTE